MFPVTGGRPQRLGLSYHLARFRVAGEFEEVFQVAPGCVPFRDAILIDFSIGYSRASKRVTRIFLICFFYTFQFPWVEPSMILSAFHELVLHQQQCIRQPAIQEQAAVPAQISKY